MVAADIMTKDVITLRPKTNIIDAVKALVNNKISGAPVVNDQGNILGVVTEKDLLVSLDFIGMGEAQEVYVEEFMTIDVITFDENTSVKEIIQTLVMKNIKRVPILRDNKVVGIVSRRDILKNIPQLSS